MKVLFLAVAAMIVIPVAGLWLWRLSDHRADSLTKKRLIATRPDSPARFEPSMVKDLPEPAKRYFRFAIQPGTPLYTVAQLSMTGKFGLGSKEDPAYMAMKATQVLAMPVGFVWKMHGRKGLLQLSGSDSANWTRFWLMGFIPVSRPKASPDLYRSAFGRYVAEAVFWTPAALLPGPGIHWEPMDENTARVTVTHNGIVQPVEITVAPDGSPTKVYFLRWSDANPDKVYRLQAFGGHLSEYREFSGFRLPTHIEAGNFFATEDYFPFFIVDVQEIEFPCP